MLNLIHAEFYKLRKSSGLKVCFLLSCICAAALALISHSIAAGNMSSDISASASGLTEIMIVSLLGSLMAGILVCSDFETKAIHDAVACGRGRSAVILSKVLIYIFIIALLLMPYTIAAVIGFSTGAEFSKPFVASVFIKILSNETGLEVTAASIGKIIMISIVTMLVHAARLMICIPLAFKIRKSIAILGIGFAFSAVIDLIIGLLDDIPLLGDLLSLTPFNKRFMMLTMDAGAGTLLKAAVTSIVFMVLITAITYKVFKRAEIK
jgi:ABC-2 type transport system permease protein